MTVTKKDIDDNYARLVNETIQDKFDEVCDRKGIERVDLSQEDALKDFPKKKDTDNQ